MKASGVQFSQNAMPSCGSPSLISASNAQSLDIAAWNIATDTFTNYSKSALNLQSSLPWTTAGDTLYLGLDLTPHVLPIGNTGDVLTVNNLATTPTWSASPLTAKGDILGRNSTVPTRIPVGNNGDSLVGDSTAATGTSYQPLFPVNTTGSNPFGTGVNSTWYGPKVTGGLISTAVSNGQVFAAPISIKRACTVDALGVSINVVGTSTSCRLALYNDLGSTTPNFPNTLLADSGLITTTAHAGSFQSATLGTPVTLTPGTYWLAIQSNASDGTFTVYGSLNVDPSLLGYIPNININTPITGAQKNFAFAAFPASWPGTYGQGGTLISGSAIPCPLLHLSA